MRVVLIALTVAVMACVGCGKGDDGGKAAAKVTDAQVKAACDNMKKLIKHEKRAARVHAECLAKVRKNIPGGKLAAYIACATAATDEGGLVTCQRAAHGK